jgi:TM2 domain-containing membrane protein YozV
MSNVIEYLPELEGDEQLYVADLVNDLSEEKARRFARVYRERRKDPQTILLLTLVGFVGVAGVHRFVIDEIGMGLLYFFTAGLCFLGTIVDIVNYKDVAFRYNRQQADEVLALIR